MPVMGPVEQEQHHWLIQPLVEAGMGLEEIRALVVRLACEDDGVLSLVRDQPARVQAAWHETVGRMIALGSGAR